MIKKRHTLQGRFVRAHIFIDIYWIVATRPLVPLCATAPSGHALRERKARGAQAGNQFSRLFYLAKAP